MRFSIKSLLFITTLAAAYAIMVRSAIHGPGWAALAGYVVLAGLVGWKLFRDFKAERAMMSEASEREKRAD